MGESDALASVQPLHANHTVVLAKSRIFGATICQEQLCTLKATQDTAMIALNAPATLTNTGGASPFQNLALRKKISAVPLTASPRSAWKDHNQLIAISWLDGDLAFSIAEQSIECISQAATSGPSAAICSLTLARDDGIASWRQDEQLRDHRTAQLRFWSAPAGGEFDALHGCLLRALFSLLCGPVRFCYLALSFPLPRLATMLSRAGVTAARASFAARAMSTAVSGINVPRDLQAPKSTIASCASFARPCIHF